LLNEKELWQEIEMVIPVCEEKSKKFELWEFIDAVFFFFRKWSGDYLWHNIKPQHLNEVYHFCYTRKY
jgi:hypothetical protein